MFVWLVFPIVHMLKFAIGYFAFRFDAMRQNTTKCFCWCYVDAINSSCTCNVPFISANHHLHNGIPLVSIIQLLRITSESTISYDIIWTSSWMFLVKPFLVIEFRVDSCFDSKQNIPIENKQTLMIMVIARLWLGLIFFLREGFALNVTVDFNRFCFHESINDHHRLFLV